MLLQQRNVFLQVFNCVSPWSGLFLLIFFSQSLFAQQNTDMTMYMFNNMAFNPAYAGSTEGINATGWIRQQYIGFKDDKGKTIGPQTYLVTVDAPLKFLHGGAGLSIYQDKIGYFSNIGIKVSYAYRAELGTGSFSAGIGVDIINTKVDFSALETAEPETGDNNPLNLKSEISGLTADMTLGAYYKIPDKFYVGLSADQILESKQKKTWYALKRHYYLTAGYNWAIPGHPLFELQPSVLVQSDGAAFSFDVDAILLYNNKFWGGLGYRYQDAVAVLAGFNIKNFRVGLSYDISTSKLSNYSGGSAEIMLGYQFKIKVEKFRKSYRNTRFL